MASDVHLRPLKQASTRHALGRGKVILLGEHGVVYGRPALAAGLDRGVVATADRAEADAIEVPQWGLRLHATADGPELGQAFHAILASYAADRPRLLVRAEVALPAGAGLGCSAAIGVAVLGAVDHALGIERSAEERGEACMAWERVFHGNPSGLDNTMAACGGLALFRKGSAPEPLRGAPRFTLVIGDSGESASTKTMVDQVARLHQKEPARIDQVFDGMASLVQNGRLAVLAGDTLALGQLLDLNHALLSSLLLSTPTLERMCEAARTAGAFGAKLTGSGGGGCMIALVDQTSAEAVRDAVEAQGKQAFVVEIGGAPAADDRRAQDGSPPDSLSSGRRVPS